ncbi:MAG: CcoQ/FixQ family Cbb3-type cytochrome c oxidase assembly chaperone [Luteibaculaceae bacterium]
MLKFVKGHMESIFGIEIFPLISFVIFFTFFVGLIIYVITMKKNYVSEMSDMPLDASQNNNAKNNHLK